MADAALVLLIVVAGAGSEPPGTTTVSAGIRDALGPDARVLAEERADAPADDDVRDTADRLNASAVAEVRWSDASRSHAVIHVFVAADRRFYDRDLAFATSDDPDERARATGLLVGTMVRAATNPEPAPPKPEPPPAPVVPRPIVPPPVERPEPAPREELRRIAIDFNATGAAPLDGQGSGLGPGLAMRLWLAPVIALRASGAARFGTIDAAGASSETLPFGAGASLRAIGRRPRDVFLFDVDVEAIALDQAATRTSPDQRQDRWLAGALAALSAGWRVAPALEAHGDVGVETGFGSTPVVVDGTTTATIPPVRIVAAAGLRVCF